MARGSKYKVTVRKTGAKGLSWEARCSVCRSEPKLHFDANVGAVVINSRGIGNRTWVLAMIAAWSHVKWHQLPL